jgi:hypothetical protein
MVAQIHRAVADAISKRVLKPEYSLESPVFDLNLEILGAREQDI